MAEPSLPKEEMEKNTQQDLVNLQSVRDVDVTFWPGSSYLLQLGGGGGAAGVGVGNHHPQLPPLNDRIREAFAAFLRERQLDPEGRVAAHYTFGTEEQQEQEESAAAAAASTAAATGGDRTTSTTPHQNPAASSSVPSSSTSLSSRGVPEHVVLALATFLYERVVMERGRFLELTTSHNLLSTSTTSSNSSTTATLLRNLPRDRVIPRLAEMFRRRLKPVGDGNTKAPPQPPLQQQQLPLLLPKPGPTTTKPVVATTTNVTTTKKAAKKMRVTTAHTQAMATTAAVSANRTDAVATHVPLSRPPTQPHMIRKRKWGAHDLLSGIHKDASAVAYVHDRAINVDAHALLSGTPAARGGLTAALANGGAAGNSGSGGGTGNDGEFASHSMYALLRSWVQDDPYRTCVDGDLLDYETVVVPLFHDSLTAGPSSKRLGAPQSLSSTATATTAKTVWECLADGREWQAPPHLREQATSVRLPDLAALTHERTRLYRQQRKARKHALRAKDLHVLEAMRKRGIHLEPRHR